MEVKQKLLEQKVQQQEKEIRNLRVAVAVLEKQIKTLLTRQIHLDERARHLDNRVQIITRTK